MESNGKYEDRVDFLPKYGRIFVDKCGVTWTHHDKHREDEEGNKNLEVYLAELKRITKFNILFYNRRHVSSSKRVLREIAYEVSLFDKWKYLLEKKRKKGSPEYQIASNGSFQYNRMISLLSREKIELRDDKIPFVEVKNFISDLNGKILSSRKKKNICDLNLADIELASLALSSGSGNGILTADYGLMDACEMVVKEYNIGSFFSCNSIECKVEYFS